MSKYEFTGETKAEFGVTFRRIRAVRDIARWFVKAGDIGGWLADEKSLDQNGNAWVSGNAWVYGNAWVSGNAWVYGNALVSGDTWVYGNAQVCGDTWVYGNAQVCGNARVYGDAQVCGNARVYGDARCLLTVGPIGSHCATLTVTADAKIGVRFSTGCFSGSRDEFVAAIKKEHADNVHAKSYAAAVALADLLIDPAPIETAEKEAA